MTRGWLLLLASAASFLWAGHVTAQVTPADAARAAARQIEAASVALQEAGSARNRVQALTATVQAFEAGLSAMRDGLRRVVIRERQIARELEAREVEIARLLGALQTLSLAPVPVLLLHPDGPVGTARTGMILSEITPALEVEAAQLRAALDEARILRELQNAAADRLRAGLTGVQDARTALSQAIAERTDLPLRFTEDPVRTALLIASSETLEGFASGLSQIVAGPEAATDTPDISALKGRLPLPAAARVLHRAGEADAAGIERPGWVLALRPGALITAPVPATIRYRGPLLDYGDVTILEPDPGLLFVFAGLQTALGTTGEIVPQGAPIGLMGGAEPDFDAIMSQTIEGTGTDRTETLYIEIREVTEPVDPGLWFTERKDGQ